MNWSMTEPEAGDIVRIELTDGLYHYGIYVSDGEVIQFGLPPVSALVTGSDVRVLSSGIDEFLAGRFLEVGTPDRQERKRMRTKAETVAYARSKIGTGGYDILYNNCEHFARECVFGVGKSEQVDAVRQLWRQRLKKD